ncbi:MAG TPA: indoleacetamide hydrolase [Trinickia sp.]|nr:indoleacetamide hydrolase [Trinickia sp.]
MTIDEDEMRALTASEAVAAIHHGRLRAVDYVQSALARAQACAGLHALTYLEVDAALASARRIDALSIDRKRHLPLAGLPVVVKANINVADMPTCAGTPSLEGFIAKRSTRSVTRLVEAGAIVLGKANMHELAVGITSTNLSPHAGPVRNPYDVTRIPGGSSGGTAAAIAARLAPAGLGTDTGGSVRIPAALTGIVGLRPSVGDGGGERRYHDPHGVVPISRTRDTVGPMARTVADVALLDAVIAAESSFAPARLAGLRIGLPAPLWGILDRQLEELARAALDRLADAGVEFVDIALPELLPLSERISAPIAFHETGRDVPEWLAANEGPVRGIEAVLERIASPDVRRIYEAVAAGDFAAHYDEAMTHGRPALQRLYAEAFAAEGVDALLFPTTPLPAAPIDAVNGSSTVSIDGGAPIDEFGAYLRNTSPGSLAGIPGLALPAGMTRAGLPIGLELDGPLGADRRLLAIGAACEAVLGVLPPPALEGLSP